MQSKFVRLKVQPGQTILDLTFHLSAFRNQDGKPKRLYTWYRTYIEIVVFTVVCHIACLVKRARLNQILKVQK